LNSKKVVNSRVELGTNLHYPSITAPYRNTKAHYNYSSFKVTVYITAQWLERLPGKVVETFQIAKYRLRCPQDPISAMVNFEIKVVAFTDIRITA